MSKFTYRTRSKCSLSDRTILDLEANLPNDLLLDAETPDSRENDEIWLKFLTNLQQETEDLFDEKDDPDFTFPEQALDAIDYEAEQIRVPRKEAFELVRDAAEFVGDEDIYDADKLIEMLTNGKEANIDESIQELLTDEGMSQETEPAAQIQATKKPQSATAEYIPQFNDSQRKQLNEQLRNHVQLLTQTCLICIDKKNEFKNIQDESLALLNLLQGLAKTNGIEILNLNEGIKLVNENKTFLNEPIVISDEEAPTEVVLAENESSSKKMDHQQCMPQKYLELIITSPVFYNQSLIPVSKYKFQSQFTKSAFIEAELRLLKIGQETFGHLSVDECAECISKHLMPNRKPQEVSRKLFDLTKTQEKKNKFTNSFKEPIPKCGLNFRKEIDYKPLIDKPGLSLPPMYTVIIERVRLSRLVEERKRLQKRTNTEVTVKKFTKRPGEPSEWLKERLTDFEIDLTQSSPAKVQHETRRISSFSSASTSQASITASANQLKQPIMQTPFLIPNDLGKILCNSTNNGSVMTTANGLPFNLPANFQGTIMIQPTIHIHTNDQFVTNEIRYRQIMPKGGLVNKRRRN